MNLKMILSVLILFIGFSLTAQTKAGDCVTTGNEAYSIINISRSYTYQEFDTRSEDSKYMIYINEKPVCELACRSRVSVKVNNEGHLKLTMKFIEDKKHPKKLLDKYYHSGPPLELDAKNGKTYFVNVDLKRYHKGMINLDYKLVEIPESEAMFFDEERFEKSPQINLFQFDLN